jgi:hypothetical protein
MYVLDINRNLLTFKSFFYNYNFLHFYINLLFRDPLSILVGYTHLFLYLNNNLFDNSLFRFLLDINFMQYPKYY